MKRGKRIIVPLILMVVVLLMGVGCAKEVVEEEEPIKGVYEDIEGITPRQEHMGNVMNIISGSETAAIVNKNQEGYIEKLQEMGLEGSNLREFAMYSDEDSVYIVIDTEIGLEAKVFAEVGEYINSRSPDGDTKERLYITSVGDYMVVIEDDNPEDVAIEMINGLLDLEYPVKSSQGIKDAKAAEIERVEAEAEFDKEVEAEQEERERIEREQEGKEPEEREEREERERQP